MLNVKQIHPTPNEIAKSTEVISSSKEDIVHKITGIYEHSFSEHDHSFKLMVREIITIEGYLKYEVFCDEKHSLEAYNDCIAYLKKIGISKLTLKVIVHKGIKNRILFEVKDKELKFISCSADGQDLQHFTKRYTDSMYNRDEGERKRINDHGEQ